jgi:hypothetical protein
MLQAQVIDADENAPAVDARDGVLVAPQFDFP